MPSESGKPTHADLGAILDLETLVALKRVSQNPKHRQQLPILEETLRQLKKQ